MAAESSGSDWRTASPPSRINGPHDRTPHMTEKEPRMALATGTQIGPYEISDFIGAGAMGEVYRAHDSRLGRDVAVKVLPAHFGADAERLRRFDQEARTAGTLNHPNVLAIYDVGSHQGTAYLV